MDFEAQYNGYLNIFHKAFSAFLDKDESCSDILKEAYTYSLTAGGKRLRPVLVLAVCDALGGNTEKALNSAIAIELIHTYSLIHDDLPAMDNDDYRRGKLTNHKVYGDAMAILAGDALLNKAYELLFNAEEVEAGKVLSFCAGSCGMVGGQALDVSDDERNAERLNLIQKNKTGKLLSASFMLGEISAKGKRSPEMETLGYSVGLLFQITDDILDVVGNFENLGKTVGKDRDENKLTAVSVYGLAGAKKIASQVAKECLQNLATCNLDTPFFRTLIENMQERIQ